MASRRAKRLAATRKAGMEEQPGLIELDLPRTFPKLSLFNEEGTLVVVVVVGATFISTPLLDGLMSTRVVVVRSLLPAAVGHPGDVLHLPTGDRVRAGHVLPGGHVPPLHGRVHFLPLSRYTILIIVVFC
jgi:hypothetical protein